MPFSLLFNVENVLYTCATHHHSTTWRDSSENISLSQTQLEREGLSTRSKDEGTQESPLGSRLAQCSHDTRTAQGKEPWGRWAPPPKKPHKIGPRETSVPFSPWIPTVPDSLLFNRCHPCFMNYLTYIPLPLVSQLLWATVKVLGDYNAPLHSWPSQVIHGKQFTCHVKGFKGRWSPSWPQGPNCHHFLPGKWQESPFLVLSPVQPPPGR